MEFLDPASVVFQYTASVVYVTGLIIDLLYTLCAKTSKVCILLERLSVLDYADMLIGPSLWPVRLVYTLYSTIADIRKAQLIVRELQSSDD